MIYRRDVGFMIVHLFPVGVVTIVGGVIAAVDGGTVTAIEKPVAYHGGDDVLGGYAFHRYGAGGTA